MKIHQILRALPLLLLPLALSQSGCTTAGLAQVKAIVADPNRDAKAAQDIIAGVSNRVLAKNPTWAGDVVALGDTFTALAQGQTGLLTVADIQAVLAKTHLSADMQAEIAADFSTAQGVLLADFSVQLPTFKPIYALFLQAVGNGFYIATGKQPLTLPSIPVPIPPAAPTSYFLRPETVPLSLSS